MVVWLFNINQLFPKKKQSKSGLIRQKHCTSMTFWSFHSFQILIVMFICNPKFYVSTYGACFPSLFFNIKPKKLYFLLDLNTLRCVSNVIMTHLKWPLPILSLLIVKLSSGWLFLSELLWDFIARREMSGLPGHRNRNLGKCQAVRNWIQVFYDLI